jgi:CHAT domain-containing protein
VAFQAPLLSGHLAQEADDFSTARQHYQRAITYVEWLLAQPSMAVQQLSELDRLQQCRYLHFATHVWIDEAFPYLAGILLSRQDSAGSEGVLQFHELMELDLTPDLLVVSACHSGWGKTTRSEGLLGLMYALRAAGSEQQVLSLWAGTDAPSARFFPAFYRYVLAYPGATYGQALRDTQRRCWEAGSDANDPYFWAPFIHFGT